MRRTVSSLAVVALMLSACDLAIHTQPKAGTTRSEAPARTRVAATPTPEPSVAVPVATPAPSPTPEPTPTATPTPTVPTTTLSGLIRLDPSYIIAAGGGKIISTGGGNIIAAGGGNIIAAGGGNIIATGGGNIIAAGGGNIIATGGGNYRTLTEASAATMLPVKGMIVVPVSLLTREQIGPAVKTDEQGRYSLSIPDSIWKNPADKENIGIYAAMPAESEQDPILTNARMHYEQVLSPEPAATPTLDEDINQATRYIRRIYEGHIASALGGGMPFSLDGVPEVLGAQLSDLITGFQKARDDAQIPEDQLPALARKIAGYVLAHQKLDEVMIVKAFTRPGWWDGAETEPLLPEVIGYMQAIRTIGADEDSRLRLANAQFVLDANAKRAPEDRIELLKGSDLCELLVEEYFLSDDAAFAGVKPVMINDLGMTERAYLRIGSAGRCLWIALGAFLQESEHNQAIMDLIQAAGHEAP